MGLEHLTHFWGRLQAHLLGPMPALQPCDPCQGGKKTTLAPQGGGEEFRLDSVCGGVCRNRHTPEFQETVAERVRQGLGLPRGRAGDRTVPRMCSWGLSRFSPVQGPYCQARSNCLSSSSSASSTLGGWGSSPAMTCGSSGQSPAPHLPAAPLLPSPRHPFASAGHCQAWSRK